MERHQRRIGRREFLAAGIAGAAGLAAAGATAAAGGGDSGAAAEMKKAALPRIGISHIRLAEFDETMATFLRQMGVEWIECWVRNEDGTREHLARYKEKVEAAGLKIHTCGNLELFNNTVFHLAGPGRDEALAQYQQFIRDIGSLGIRNTIYAWTPGGVATTGKLLVRGCEAREFDAAEAVKNPPKFDREYPPAEVWANYRWFMERMLPVAEEAGVLLGLHPCDPPITLGGAARIFCSVKDMERMVEVNGGSPAAGVQFCVGTFGEMAGPGGRGEDIPAAVRKFGDRITGVHFRNVSGPLPKFHETFMDNGYIDMPAVMDALVEVGFEGIVVPDHVPGFEDEKRIGPMGVSGTPMCIGYIRGLLKKYEKENA